MLHLERDEWKIVQVHWSFPAANTEIFGRALTVTLDELEETVLREQPDLTASRALDGTVTIVFTDIVDSTPTLARLGDAAWVAIVQRHRPADPRKSPPPMTAPSSRRRATDRCSPSGARAARLAARRPSSRRSREPSPIARRRSACGSGCHRGCHQGRRAFLRDHGALRRAGREPCRWRGGSRVQCCPRAPAEQCRVHVPARPGRRAEGDPGTASAVRAGVALSAAGSAGRADRTGHRRYRPRTLTNFPWRRRASRWSRARRAATRAPRIGERVTESTADAWIAAWDAQAARDGLERGAAYWDAGWSWIAEQRRSRVRP